MKLSEATCPKCNETGGLFLKGEGTLTIKFDRADCDWTEDGAYNRLSLSFVEEAGFSALLQTASHNPYGSFIKCSCGWAVRSNERPVWGYNEGTLNERLAEVRLEQRFEVLKKKHPRSPVENALCPNCGEKRMRTNRRLLRSDDPEVEAHNNTAVLRCAEYDCKEAGVRFEGIGHAFAMARFKTRLLANAFDEKRAESSAKFAFQRKAS